jgi:dephospho-CoA kinase
MTVRVGLTGGIGSGKSTVLAILRELGAVVIDADALAREVVEKGTPGLRRVVEEFGDGVLTPAGDLDREAMARIVFGDDAARRRLEAIVHPLVFERMVELEQQAGPEDVVIHDIPLLAEGGRADTFDAVVVVDVPTELQLERLTTLRGMAEADARSRLDAQSSRADRLSIATHVVDNSRDLEHLRSEVERVWSLLEELRG